MLQYELHSDRLRTASTISSRFLAENFHRRSHECSLEQNTFGGAAGVLRVPAVFREGILRVLAIFRGSVLRVLYTPKYFGVQYCGYSGTRTTLTDHNPSNRSIQAFGTVHTPSIQAFSAAHTPSTRSTRCTRYSEYTRSTKYTGSICGMLMPLQRCT